MKRFFLFPLLVTLSTSAQLGPTPIISGGNTAPKVLARGIVYRNGSAINNFESAFSGSSVGDSFILGPGVFCMTNQIVMKNNQSIIGYDPIQTAVIFAGGQYSSNNNGLWTGIELATNVYLANFSIYATNWQANFFAACIGGSTGGKGFSNAVVQNVWMYGDTDNFYVDNTFHADGTLNNCRFYSQWDTLAVNTSGHPGSIIRVNNSTFNNLGPSVSSPSSPAVCLRNSNARTALILNNCDFTSSQYIGSGGNMRLMHCRINTTNQLAFYNNITLLPLYFEDVNIIPLQIDASANNNMSSYVQINNSSSNFVAQSLGGIGTPSYGWNIEDTNRFPQVGLGQIYFDNTTKGLRIFNGIEWQALTPAMDTNKAVLSGRGDAYDGVYKQDSYVVDALPGVSWTNRDGVFFMFTTNANADGVVGISATKSMISGAEIDLGGVNIDNTHYALAPKGSWANTPTTLTFADKTTLSNAVLVIGTAYTNQTGKVQTICGLNGTATVAAVSGKCTIQLELSDCFTNEVFSMPTTASSITGTYTNALPTIMVPSGSRYLFKNTSTGTGNSTALANGQRL